MVAIQFKCTYNRYRKLTVWHNATATRSKCVEDNLSWVLDSMANVNVACNQDLVVHTRATDVAGLRGIGGMTKLEEIGT